METGREEEEVWDTEQRVDWQGDKIRSVKKKLNKIKKIEFKHFVVKSMTEI